MHRPKGALTLQALLARYQKAPDANVLNQTLLAATQFTAAQASTRSGTWTVTTPATGWTALQAAGISTGILQKN